MELMVNPPALIGPARVTVPAVPPKIAISLKVFAQIAELVFQKLDVVSHGFVPPSHVKLAPRT